MALHHFEATIALEIAFVNRSITATAFKVIVYITIKTNLLKTIKSYQFNKLTNYKVLIDMSFLALFKSIFMRPRPQHFFHSLLYKRILTVKIPSGRCSSLGPSLTGLTTYLILDQLIRSSLLLYILYKGLTVAIKLSYWLQHTPSSSNSKLQSQLQLQSVSQPMRCSFPLATQPFILLVGTPLGN